MGSLSAWKNDLRYNAPVAKYTTARLGGNAEILYVVRSLDDMGKMTDIVQAAWQDGIPVRVLGGAANVLVSDKGVSGLLIVNHIADIQFGKWHDGRNVSASSGTGLLALARRCASQGLSGLEWLAGVPGTVGGAVVNNAGAHGSDMSDSLADVVVLEREGPGLYIVDELQYGYRESLLKHRTDRDFVVLLATFRLNHAPPLEIQTKMTEYNVHRKRTQPPGASLGSIFKNPPGDYAGRLIEACNLKGAKIGDVQVSPVHANFFVNGGDATATDYFRLIEHVQETVQRQTGILLELEIERVGEW